MVPAQSDSPTLTASLNTWRNARGGSVSPELMPGRPLKAVLGWDGVILFDADADVVRMAYEFSRAAEAESCGQCFPCRLGSERMRQVLERVVEHGGTEDDLTALESAARMMSEAARCDIGLTSPVPILDLLRERRDDFLRPRTPGAQPADRYVTRVTAPCTNACPSHVDIPGYVEAIRFEDDAEGLARVRRDCMLPGTIGRVCVRPCESACRRSQADHAISIRSLKRYLADEELARDENCPSVMGQEQAEKVAVIGAGPAGLSCAYYLGLAGYHTTVFEADDEPGGMAAVGIPDYRLPRPILRRESEVIESLGGEILYGRSIGCDFGVDDLKREGYSAVFVGVGAPGTSKMDCPGEDQGYEGYMPGVEFLREVAKGRSPLAGDSIAVIGGGNVAMDCARTARRAGFKDVYLIYRRTETEMPADAVEVHEAKEEDVHFEFLVAPVEILATDGTVTALRCRRMELGEPDSSGRRRPVPVEGSEFDLPVDAVVAAIGQVCSVDSVVQGTEAGISRWNTLDVDAVTMQSADPFIFGGGDCVTGPDSLIAALAAGKTAARSIIGYLRTGAVVVDEGELLEDLAGKLGIRDADDDTVLRPARERACPAIMDPGQRVVCFDEVEDRFTKAEARIEADRCMRCYRIAVAVL